MDQESVIADIEHRAFIARVSMNRVCREAGLDPTTFSRWKKSDRNPEPIGATLRSIGKLYDALAKLERDAARARRARKAVAA
ncbi:MAG: transposase [Sphingomonadales bacterium]|nr:transposase [Sphingomonadales bacterium]